MPVSASEKRWLSTRNRLSIYRSAQLSTSLLDTVAQEYDMKTVPYPCIPQQGELHFGPMDICFGYLTGSESTSGAKTTTATESSTSSSRGSAASETTGSPSPTKAATSPSPYGTAPKTAGAKGGISSLRAVSLLLFQHPP